jgi:hypothetical protein
MNRRRLRRPLSFVDESEQRGRYRFSLPPRPGLHADLGFGASLRRLLRGVKLVPRLLPTSMDSLFFQLLARYLEGWMNARRNEQFRDCYLELTEARALCN